MVRRRGAGRSLERDPAGGVRAGERPGSRSSAGLIALFFLLGALALQVVSGAYRTEMGRISSDEAAHFISGLFVRDYLLHAPGADPVRYALEYYAHYPKVGIGNWPPLFYALQGMWMTLLPASPASVLVLIAGMAAATSWTIFLLLRRTVPRLGAAFAGLLFLLLPPVPAYLSAVMTEVPLTLLVTLAVFCWIRFILAGRARDAVAFGALTVLAVLTKGNGLLLCMVPPLAILLGRHWWVVRSRALWGSVVAVLLLAIPWTWFFFDTVREGWSSVGFSVAYTLDALVNYPHRLVGLLGVAVTCMAGVGAWAGLRTRGERDRAIWSASVAAVVAVILFHALVPSGIGGRHLVLAFPFAAMLAARGVQQSARWLERWLQPRSASIALGVCVAVGFGAESFRIPRGAVHGYGSAAAAVKLLGAPGPSTSLIASDAIGESAYIAEVAVRDRQRPSDTVWRSSKLLASMTWAGRDYRLNAASGQALVRLIDDAGVRWVVFDRTAASSPHLQLLERTMRDRPDRFRLRRRTTVSRADGARPGELLLYEVTASSGGARGPRLRQRPGYRGMDTIAPPVTFAPGPPRSPGSGAEDAEMTLALRPAAPKD